MKSRLPSVRQGVSVIFCFFPFLSSVDAESSLNFPAEKTNLVPRVALKAEQIDRDMSMIHRLAEQVIKSTEEQPAKDV